MLKTDDVHVIRCPECGSDVDRNATICPACGAKLTAEGPAAVTTQQPFISRHLERLLLLAGIAVIAAGTWTILKFDHQAAVRAAGKSLEYGNPFTLLVMGVVVAVLVTCIVTAQRGRLPFLRRIPGLQAIDEAVGRATEMGRPILFSTGLRGVESLESLQALAIAGHVGRTAARYGSRLILPVCDQTMVPVTEQVIRESYTAEGRPEHFQSEDIRYLSDRQFAYAAGVTGILHRERPAASFLFGLFFAESLILAENGQAVGAIQVAGTPDLLQIPFFVVTCDYTIIGDEFYAATAYLTREPTLIGSLVGQDIGKTLILALILAGMAISIFVEADKNVLMQFLGGQ
jgi:hypothetical protein